MISKRGWKTVNAFVIILFWIFLGTGIFYYIEPWTLIESFYFAVSTLTTVGYGDLTPNSQLSKLFASLYILFGVGIVFTSLGVLGREFLRKEEANLKRKYANTKHKEIEGVKEVESEIKSVKRLLKKNAKDLENANVVTVETNSGLSSKTKKVKSKR